MTALRRFFTNWWVLSILVAVLAALILCLLLPLLVHPLGKLLWRLGLLGLVVLVWAIFAAIHVFSARNASDRIADAMAKEKAETEDEGAVVGKRLADALAQLKSQSKRRDYLYSRPWYLIIGPPGAGKTTALTSSGLRFPFADAVVRGVGGTRNLDFMFADEAVLVDTAGRYTSQDSSAERDRQGWLRFLDVLRKNRPLQPVNGVLVAIGVDTLLTADAAEIDRHGDIIRRRLAELREGLEINAPVYVVFTKTDLLAGFAEFFDDLDVEQRRAVLGRTFDAEAATPDAAELAVAFDEVAEAVAGRTPKRLQDELDARRRGLIVGFPSQLSSLRNAVVRLVQGAFPKDAREGAARLRGFYFTSGVQQGTPLDRLLGGIASVYDAPAPAAAHGRAYFLNRLLMEVIFGEAGLAEGTAGVKRRRAALLTGGLVAISAVSALILVAWIASFAANLQFQKRMETAATQVAQQLKQPGFDLAAYSENDRTLEDASPILDALRALPRGYDARRKGGAPFPMNMGLYQEGLSRQAEDVYLEASQRIMLPRLILRLERYQRDHDSTPMDLYGALKSYLLLGGQGPGGKVDPDAVKSWVTADWARESIPGADREPIRLALGRHLDAVLKDKAFGRYWAQPPIDRTVVDASRNRLETLTPGQRAYAAMKSRAEGSGPDWRLQIEPGKLIAFANGPALQALRVPYFFTRAGYQGAYLPAKLGIPAMLAEDRWVLGGGQANLDPRDISTEIAMLYANDYIAQWRQVMQAPRPANVFADSAAADAMIGVGQNRPYVTFLNQVYGQVNFDKQPAVLKLPSTPFNKLVAGPNTADAGQQIAAAFQDMPMVIQQVNGLLDKLKALILANRELAASTGAVGGAPPPMPSIDEGTIGMPPGVKDFFTQLKSTGQTATTAASLAALKGSYAANTTVKSQCQQTTTGYPFVRGAADANLQAAMNLFSDAGPLAQTTAQLASYLDEGGAWHWKTGAPADLNPETPERLRQAKAVGAILRPEGLQLQVRALEFAPGVTSATLAIGDSVHVFNKDVPDVAPMRWSPNGNGIARVTFIGQQTPFEGRGDWALFRLFQTAKIDSAGAGKVKARFGGGAAYVTFLIELPAGTPNPFSSDPWAFRCPANL
ncbi:MAG TPA: type VI secretion system membrane subunit TssM [Caulobacteraceae bacterium]|nr:type VI secretion system membrane subunit TssM [Caulobacteraceae bacterium]